MQPADPVSTEKPAIVFLHGALNDHSIWSHQRAALTARGHAVIAPDLPGHGPDSPGPALTGVEAMAGWLLARLEAAGVARALLVGHSMGSLIALEAARQDPARIAGLALLGTAAPMNVSDALLASALDDQAGAIAMVAQWSHAPAPAAADDGRGAPSLQERSRQLMTRIAQDGPPGLLHTDLSACKAYAGGPETIAALDCPVLFILGRLDRMTPPRAAAALTQGARHGTLVEVDAGHGMMAEQPEAVLEALAAFAAGVR